MFHNFIYSDKNSKNIVIKLGQVFCIVPWHDENTKELSKRPFNKALTLVYLLMPIWGLYYLLSKYRHFNFFNDFDGILYFSTETISIFSTTQVLILVNFIKMKRWRKLFRLIEQVELSPPEAKFQFLWLIVGHLLFLFTRVVTNLNNLNKSHFGWKTIAYIPYEAIQHYYFFLSTLVICHYVGIIKSGLKCSRLLLKKYTSNNDMNDQILQQKIREIGKTCRYLFKISENYNDIFGWTVLFIFSNAIVQVLRATNLILFLLRATDRPFTMVVFFWGSSIFCFAESIYIIICCEYVSLASKKIKEVCHKLQEDVRLSSASREEFFKLAEVVSTFTPKLTAANFFVINRGTILGIVNVSTTYLLVIVQFYISQHLHLQSFEEILNEKSV